jgi:CHAT domain-containing protein/tetratricopeptide (TPR) repeat protein
MNPFRILSLFVLLICLTVWCVAQPATTAPTPQSAATPSAKDEAEVRSVVEQFFAAYAKKDLDGVMKLWSEKSPEYANRKEALSRLFATEDHTFSGLRCSHVKIEDSKAGLRVSVDLKAISAQSKQAREERMVRQISFVREDGQWKMWMYGSAAEEIAKALIAAQSEGERQVLLADEKEIPTANIIQGLFDQANRFYEKQDYEQALRVMEVARHLAEQVNNSAALAIALNNTAFMQSASGRTSEAIENYQLSIKISERLEDKSHHLNAISNLGNLYQGQGNYSTALKIHERGLAAARLAADKTGVADALSDLGNDYKGLGDFDIALKHHRESLTLGEDLKSARIIARSLGNMANVHKLRGNYREALELYFRVLKLAEEIKNPGWHRLTLNNIGEVYFAQGNYELALEYYQKVGTKEQSNNIANVYTALGRYDEALKIHQDNLRLAESWKNKRLQSMVLFNIGMLYREQGKYDQAVEYYQKSLEAEQGDDKLSLAQTLSAIGDMQVINGNYMAALESAERALALAMQTNDRETTWRIQTVLGQANQELGKVSKARQAFDSAITTIESIRTAIVGGDQEHQQFFENKLSPYLGMVGLLTSQSSPAEALSYAERAKARVLLDVLSRSKMDAPKATTAQEMAQEDDLRRQLVSLNTQLTRESQVPQPDQKRLSEIKAQLQKVRLAYLDFEAKLFAIHPELRAKRGNLLPVTFDEISKMLPDNNTVFLEYVVGDSKLFLFVIGRGGSETQDKIDLKVASIKIKRKDLAEVVQKYRGLMAGRELDFKKEAAALYDLLLKPAQALIEGKSSIVIVPDGPLWELPFQAMITPGKRFLAEESAVSYAPSLTFLREMAKARRRDSRGQISQSLLAIGNPALGQETIARAQSGRRDEKLEPLPLAEKEAQVLAGLYGAKQSKVMIGAEALEERFKAEAGNYRVLHLATHGVLNDSSPMYSHVLLSQTGAGEKEDGLLEAWEIMNLDLKADLAVLSACETARGRIGVGEGVIGLSWALFVAGVPTTVASQWKVLDASTQELMVEFHRQLRTKPEQGKAEALRQASLKLLKQEKYRHPFYWAGFVLVGDGR